MANHTEFVMQFIAFLAQEEGRFERFVSLTGLGLADIRQRHDDPEFQALVLDYGLQDQSLVLEYAANQGIKPDEIMKVRNRLPMQPMT